MSGIVESWFGESFQKLDPLIQRLHQLDHTLKGSVQIEYSKGLSGRIGRSFAQKLGIPTNTGKIPLSVDIRHASDHFVWSRQFGGDGPVMTSKFYPVGAYPNGGWLESTGGVEITLGVEIKYGAWHWKQKSVRIHGIPAPDFTSPKVVAFKEVVDEKYNFYVEFLLPGLGRLFTYQGLLKAEEI